MSANTGRKINYSLRPSKCVERKMICEFMQRSNSMHKIRDYKYIGLGSFYFEDFRMFHNTLQISDMISIEADKDHKERYEFNKPYNCIEIKFDTAKNVLSKVINWEDAKRHLIWLDYDSKLSRNHLEDYLVCARKVKPGSYLCTTFSLLIGDDDEGRFTYLKNNFAEFIDDSVKYTDCDLKGVIKIIWSIFNNALKTTAMEINQELDNPLGEERITFEPVMFFQYKDGTPMLTLCYLVAADEERENISNGLFNDITFYCPNSNVYTINTPQLTWLEIRKLNSYLPNSDLDEIKNEMQFINDNDLKDYIKIYKYYPRYFECQGSL